MGPQEMVKDVLAATEGWEFDCVSIGYPGPVVHDRPIAEPHNLAPGWVGFRYQKAFARPLKIMNDAAMQALGSYKGGRMLFLGLGTGLGSAMIADGQVEPMELAHLPYKKGKTYEEYVGLVGLERRGQKKWQKSVLDVIARLRTALQCDYVVLGGGNAKLLKTLPEGVFLGSNANAILGGERMWRKSQDAVAGTAKKASAHPQAKKRNSKPAKDTSP